MKTMHKLATVLALSALAAGAAQADSALTTRAAELLSLPQSDAAPKGSVAENTRVEILRRNGAWTEVKAPSGQTGWLRMLGLKPEAGAEAPAAKGGAPALAALGGLLTGGRTSNSGTATTGVRGLSEEDLKNASANPAEMQKAQRYAADRARAQAFAEQNRLTAEKLDYFVDPATLQGGK